MPAKLMSWLIGSICIVAAIYVENEFLSFQSGLFLFRPSLTLFLLFMRPPVLNHFIVNCIALVVGQSLFMPSPLAQIYTLADLILLGTFYYFGTQKKALIFFHSRKAIQPLIWITVTAAASAIALAAIQNSQLILGYAFSMAISIAAYLNLLIIIDQKNLNLLARKPAALTGTVLLVLLSLFFYVSLPFDVQTPNMLGFFFLLLTLLASKNLGPASLLFAVLGFFVIAISQMPNVSENRLWFFLVFTLTCNALIGRMVAQNFELQEKRNIWSIETEKLKKMQTLFLANVSHELRTPLTAIIGYTEILLEKSTEFQTELKAMRQSEDNLLGILNSILSFSQPPSSELASETDQFTIKDVFTETEAFFQPTAKQRQLKLQFTYGPDMASIVISNKQYLKEILVHLINNAFKFTKTGGIDISAQIKNARLYFSVEDTGVGIPQERIKNLFSPFYQVNASMARAYGGLGLGLAICAKLVRQLGGKIEVSSQKNQGTRFDVEIPITVSATVAPTAVTESLKPQTQILLVDDSPDNVDIMSLFLQQQGANVTVASNGKEALDNVTKNEKDFDLILMDMQMPIMDGYQATKLLRQRGITTPIVAVTAHTAYGEKEKCLKIGCNDYLAKPFSKESFLEKVNLNISQPLHSH